ncbi:hypothetical protein [Ilumatobacter nonamiensis]|uniref:hypothetical protein n=1 Tax=Ilumatobacter nonamiensis TaxID=467093 RepID=UPI00034DD774|nr:hypothetical protein [Ilumatobacter nonamiensis]
MTNPHDATPDPKFGFDRRTFLIGAATAGVAAACGGGSDSNGEADSGGASDAATADLDSYVVVPRFPSDVLVPGEVRLPFSLARTAELVTDGPDQLTGQVVDLDGNAIGDPIIAVRRDVTPAPYYAFRPTMNTPGVYGIRIDDGTEADANFQVTEPSLVAVPGPGDVLAGFDTPTAADPGGVDPICTREPECPFHAMTLTEALASGSYVAYIVGTPAFCQTGTCAPALETMVDVAPDYADSFVFVHAEVWTDTTATEVAPAVATLDMQFEPALFIVGPDGTVIERLDGLWDETELRERLDLSLT